MNIQDTLASLTTAGPPLTGYHFRVDFGLPGLFVKDVGFKEVSGISLKLKTEEASVPGTSEKLVLPNGYEYGDLKLSRGMFVGSKLIDWLEAQIKMQDKYPIPIIVTTLDENRSPIYSWVFINAYPIELSTKGFNAEKGEILIEEITFKYWFYKQVNLSSISAGLQMAMNNVK